jgi:hypothetical protein
MTEAEDSVTPKRRCRNVADKRARAAKAPQLLVGGLSNRVAPVPEKGYQVRSKPACAMPIAAAIVTLILYFPVALYVKATYVPHGNL